MKRIIALFLSVLLLACGLLSGAAAENKKISIVTTIFPIYDWAREVAACNEKAELTMLLDTGTDLHSYQPTAADILKVATADLFIYVGGESDDWVEAVLKNAMNPNMIVINLLDALGDDVKAEELVEGMEEDAHGEEEEEEEEADEHVWLSLRNAQKLVQAIADALAQIDPDLALDYQANAVAYNGSLRLLDQQYKDAVEEAEIHTILFGDRFPFRYLADDYGLSYYAAFSGCHAETEASFQTVIFLANKVDELDLPVVLTIEKSKTRIAETIVQNTRDKNQRILEMDSLQSVTAADRDQGVTYLSVMAGNLEALKEALKGNGGE